MFIDLGTGPQVIITGNWQFWYLKRTFFDSHPDKNVCLEIGKVLPAITQLNTGWAVEEAMGEIA